MIGKVSTFLGEHVLSKEEIVRFAMEWDPQPFHIDEKAAESSLFGGLVAASVHLFSIGVKLTHSAPHVRAAVSVLGFTDMKVRVPARPGDTLKLRATCINKRESKSRPGTGIIEDKTELVNQRGEVVFSFVCAALYAKRS